MLKKKNFRETTKSLFLKYTVIPIFILILLFGIFTIFAFHIKIVYDASRSAKNIQQKMTAVYDVYANEINRMAGLPVVIDGLINHRKVHLIYEEFYNFNNEQEVKSAFYLIDRRDIFVASTTASDSEINQKILKDILPRIDKNPDEVLVDVARTQLSHGKTSVITLGKAVQQNDQIIGYLVYKMYEEDFQHLIFGEKADIAVVTDEYKHIVVATNGIVKGLMNKFIPEKISDSHVQIKDQNYYMKKLKTDNGLFTIYTLIIKKTNHIVFILYAVFIFITCGLLYFLVNMLAEKMSQKNTQSIDKLLAAVSRLEKGDLTSYVDIKTGDEFELLANQYNVMLDNLNDVIKRKKELAEIRKMDEIKLLQSQFNPHFLFNVLETLRYTMVSNIEKSQDIILSLSGLLRYSINNTANNVLFEKDLNYIIDYLKLHKLRFNHRLHYKLDISEEVKHTYVPKLLLQPIIENAIKYGYKNQITLSIWIKAEVIGGRILFTVIDDGNGIAEKELNDIRNKLYSSKNNQVGIGLYNTHRRLVLQYGPGFGLSIHSALGKGTKVEIKIPYSKGVEQRV